MCITIKLLIIHMLTWYTEILVEKQMINAIMHYFTRILENTVGLTLRNNKLLMWRKTGDTVWIWNFRVFYLSLSWNGQRHFKKANYLQISFFLHASVLRFLHCANVALFSVDFYFEAFQIVSPEEWHLSIVPSYYREARRLW